MLVNMVLFLVNPGDGLVGPLISSDTKWHEASERKNERVRVHVLIYHQNPTSTTVVIK